MTAIAVPTAMSVAVSMAAPYLNDGCVLGRNRRYSQPRGRRADKRQNQ